MNTTSTDAMISVTNTARTPKTMPRRRRILIATAFVLFANALLVVPHSKEKRVESMGENRVTMSLDGTRIAFTKMGFGPPVVLVDGAFCYRENGPAPELAPLLAQHFTVFVYDRRGRGESGDTPPYAIGVRLTISGLLWMRQAELPMLLGSLRELRSRCKQSRVAST